MASFYSIAQYVPEPISGERVNFGVLVVDGARLHCRFVSNWTRVQRFGGEDIAFLRHFAADVEVQAAGFLRLPSPSSSPELSERLASFATAWSQSIQLTPLRASLESGEKLLETIAPRVLRDRSRRQPTHRDHRHAANIAAKAVENAIERELGTQFAKVVRRKPELPGKLSTHEFDVAIWNGQPLLAASGLSFESDDPKRLALEVNARAFAAGDVKAAKSRIDLAVVVLPPLAKTKSAKASFAYASHVFKGMGVTVITEGQAAEWAQERAHALKKRIHLD